MKFFTYIAFSSIIIGIFSFTLFTPQVNAQGWTQGLQSVRSANTGLPETDAKSVIISIVKWLLSIVFWLAVFAFVASGLIFIMSFGNSSLHGMAKDWLMFAIIGLVVAVLGYIIVISISNILIGRSIRGTGAGGSGPNGSIIFDQGGVWGEVNVPIGDNGDITINNDGVSGDINLPW